MTKFIYIFGCDQDASNEASYEHLGGKGASLQTMSCLDINVPPGFTISTEICDYYYKNNHSLPESLLDEIEENLSKIEKKLGQKFGSVANPLIISVRSGAKISMPGMMDTVLNLGLNDETVLALAKRSGNERFAYDCYRRLIQMYGNVVLNIDSFQFEEVLDLRKIEKKYKHDQDLNTDDLKYLIKKFKEIILDETGKEFPSDVQEQLASSIKAVLESWMSNRAITYRRINNISDNLGTGVTIQSMVFGNYDAESGTGVLFSRNPSTGENSIFGEYLQNAQGEDLVAGIRTPLNLHRARDDKILPEMLYQELQIIAQKLEKHYLDMQDIEFTIQQGNLWILQTRSAKRTINASIKIAIDLVNENIITKEESLLRIDVNALGKMLHPTINSNNKYEVFAKGLPASPGAASGVVVFTANEAERRALTEKVILVRHETCPEDIHGIHAAEGILTCKGGMTSHAAVVARGMGKSCICGAVDITIDYKNRNIKKGNITINEGDVITLNGDTGEVIIGLVETVQPNLSGDFQIIMDWAKEFKRMSVRANSETVVDTIIAQKFGAEGIGLCRTEHMFFDSERINIMREMILATSLEARHKALAKLLPMQIRDFESIIEIMDSSPVNIRLLDPPLNEFISNNENEIATLANLLDLPVDKIRAKILELAEQNPMLGHRGCRLGITYPEIYQMQATAIFTALNNLISKGLNPIVEIMIPLILGDIELQILKENIHKIASELNLKHKLHYKIGTMIELPRACLVAEQIAVHADYFSFGTNDLTQTTLGISRDDASSFISKYIEKNIFKIDPFVEIDINGVGFLMKLAIEKAKQVNPKMTVSVCGEHAGNPASISFFNEIDIDYISCSPYRLPIAILAAAQASIRSSRKNS